MNGSVSRLLFSGILVAQQCAAIVLRLKGVIADFHVVSGLKRHLHRVITLVHWGPAGTRTLVFAGILRLWRGFGSLWRGFGKSWRRLLAGTAATPAADANDVGQRVRIAVLLARLLLVYLGDDVVHRALSGTRWRRRLRKHPRAENNHGYCASDVHPAIISADGPPFPAFSFTHHTVGDNGGLESSPVRT